TRPSRSARFPAERLPGRLLRLARLARILDRLGGFLRLVFQGPLAGRDVLELFGVLLEGVRSAALVDDLLCLIGESSEVDHLSVLLVQPGFLRGTSTARLNSATSVPSWL